MGLVQKEIPPPELKEGEVLPAAILEIVSPVESKYKDAHGNPKQQADFHIKLDSGFKAHCFCAYYEKPSERSVIGALIQTLEQATDTNYQVGEIGRAIRDLQDYGRIYVKVSGFREWNDKLYPKFKLVPGRLPPKSTTQTVLKKLTMQRVLEDTEGWTEERRQNYIRYLEDMGQLVPS